MKTRTYIIYYTLFIIATGSFSKRLFGQENQFTQIYTVSPYINPAFTGDVHNMRINMNLRLYSPIPGETFTNAFVSVDHKLRNHHSSFGALVYHQKQSINHLKVQLNYGYTANINENWAIKGGVAASANLRKTNLSALTFPDMYTDNGLSGNQTLEPYLHNESVYPTFAAGGLIYSNHFWLGFATDNINEPTENFAGTEQKISMKYGIHGGYTFLIGKKISSKRRISKHSGIKPYPIIGPIFSYVIQDPYSYTNIGISTQWQPFFVCLHFNMVSQNLTEKNAGNSYKGLGVIIGYRKKEFALSYLYEAALHGSEINKNGAHEISFIYYFLSTKEDYKKVRLVPLPNQFIY